MDGRQGQKNTAREKKRMRGVKREALWVKKTSQPSVRSRAQDWVMNDHHVDIEDWGKYSGTRRSRPMWERKKNGQDTERDT